MQQLLPPAPAEHKRARNATASACEAPSAGGDACADLLAEAAVEVLPGKGLPMEGRQGASPAAALAGSEAGFAGQEGRRGGEGTQVISAPELAGVVAGTAKPPILAGELRSHGCCDRISQGLATPLQAHELHNL